VRWKRGTVLLRAFGPKQEGIQCPVAMLGGGTAQYGTGKRGSGGWGRKG
jgi:hypothetical protein